MRSTAPTAPASCRTACQARRGVTVPVSVSFMTQKLTLEADDAEFDEVLQRVVDYTADAEPDCEIIL